MRNELLWLIKRQASSSDLGDFGESCKVEGKRRQEKEGEEVR